jgi:hypothetical protein
VCDTPTYTTISCGFRTRHPTAPEGDEGFLTSGFDTFRQAAGYPTGFRLASTSSTLSAPTTPPKGARKGGRDVPKDHVLSNAFFRTVVPTRYLFARLISYVVRHDAAAVRRPHPGPTPRSFVLARRHSRASSLGLRRRFYTPTSPSRAAALRSPFSLRALAGSQRSFLRLADATPTSLSFDLTMRFVIAPRSRPHGRAALSSGAMSADLCPRIRTSALVRRVRSVSLPVSALYGTMRPRYSRPRRRRCPMTSHAWFAFRRARSS